MLKLKNKLNSNGFGHIEFTMLITVVVCIFGIGYFVLNHIDSHKSNSYTSLATFSSEGVQFEEEACISSQSGSSPNQIDTVLAKITVDNQAGPSTEITSHGRTSGGYNPLAYYVIDSQEPVTTDNWVTGYTSSISFTLSPTSQNSSFSLGIEPSSTIMSSGSYQIVGSLSLCSPSAKVANLSTISNSPTNQTSTSSSSSTSSSTSTTSATPTSSTTSSTSSSPDTSPSSKSTTTTSTTVSPSSSKTTSTAPTTTITKTSTPTPSQAIPPSPTVSLKASSTSLVVGGSNTISWSSTNASSCSASNSWAGSKSTSGSVSTGVFNTPAGYTYTLDCIGNGGNISSSVTINVSGTPLIIAGNSKTNCIELNAINGFIDDSQISAITSITGVNYNCVLVYNQPMPNWADWDTPWAFNSYYNWGAWIAQSTNHQVIFGQDLIPQSIQNNSDPLTWEQECDAGDFNSYATALGQDLVSNGGSSLIIRLGIEANGTWETDYVGTTTQEQNAWAQCYDNEVTAMRAVPNSHFLFVWNPNICTGNMPLNEWYPGNNYVDIIGADAYDEDCWNPQTVSQEGWSAYYTDPTENNPYSSEFPSLSNIVSFAAANNKPFALPEWGESSSLPDDPTYVTDMANLVKNNNTSFQAWFDDGSQGTRMLGSSIPLSTSAYKSAF